MRSVIRFSRSQRAPWGRLLYCVRDRSGRPQGACTAPSNAKPRIARPEGIRPTKLLGGGLSFAEGKAKCGAYAVGAAHVDGLLVCLDEVFYDSQA
jgi:hypothetical protein